MKIKNTKNHLSTKQIRSLYNIYRLVRAEELPSLSKTYKNNSEIILVFMKRKTKRPRITLNDLMKEIKSIKLEIVRINVRLDAIVEANHLIDPTQNIA